MEGKKEMLPTLWQVVVITEATHGFMRHTYPVTEVICASQEDAERYVQSQQDNERREIEKIEPLEMVFIGRDSRGLRTGESSGFQCYRPGGA